MAPSEAAHARVRVSSRIVERARSLSRRAGARVTERETPLRILDGDTWVFDSTAKRVAQRMLLRA
jgi:hypothetical protein